MTNLAGPPRHAPPDSPPAPSSAATYAPWLLLAPAAAYVVIAPNVGIYYSGQESYDVWRGLQIALLVALAGAFVLVPAAGRLVTRAFGELPARARGALAAVAAVGLASSLLSVRPLYALRQLALFALLFLLVVAVAAAARALGERAVRGVAQAVALSAFFYLTLFFAVLVFDPWNTRGWSLNPFVGFATPRFLGHLQSWTIPLIVLPALDGRDTPPLTRAVFWAAAAGWWMLFLVSGSRAPALSLAIGIAVAGVCFGGKALHWLAAQGAALAAGAAAYALILSVDLIPGLDGSAPVGVGSALERGAGTTGRIVFWRHAGTLVEGSPLLGVGPGNYAYFRPPAGPGNPGGPVAHPHNAVLQWAAEWGAPATLLLMGLLVWGMWRWTAARRRELRHSGNGGRPRAAVALTAAGTAAAIHSCFDGIAVMPLPQTVGAVVIGLALGMHLPGRSGAPPRRVSPLAGALVVLAAAILLWTLRLPTRPRAADEQSYYPAFWAEGAIP